MKKLSLIALGIVLLPGMAMAADLQGTATASGTGKANAEIVSALKVEKTQDLDFGKMLGKGNVVTVTTAGARSESTPGGLVDSTAKQGQITVSGGVKDQQITITGPASPTEVTHKDTTAKMTVDNYTTAPNGSTQLGDGGQTTINVGADLHVSDGQKAGKYTGTYPITITY